MALKFSSAKPTGSITPWQEPQEGFARWASRRSRTVVVMTALPSPSMLVSTPGGGSGGGAPWVLPSIQAPRMTGEVRVAVEVTVRMLPCPSSPRRCVSAGSCTFLKFAPCTPAMP
jgi:hypothetical protein